VMLSGCAWKVNLITQGGTQEVGRSFKI